jgi:GTPase
MASIFTYDPDPPRISSPWSTPPVSTPRLNPTDDGDVDSGHRLGGLASPTPIRLSDCGISKLEAEPQEGPTEYKLHLLLRPRRSIADAPPESLASGFSQPRSPSLQPEAATVGQGDSLSFHTTPTTQSRQNRLQHLTTQLLWRLQQSSPYHASSTADLVLPLLPGTAAELSHSRPEKLLPGLEESRGALYEIGVSDDGTFVGLTEDEMHESLTNLRAMATSLGCRVEILRTVIVDETSSRSKSTATAKHEDLIVSEVLILPDTDIRAPGPALTTPLAGRENLQQENSTADEPEEESSQVEQLRVSLTGATTSGKSSLLGTLSTSTLDNGRGKSRLSLLKHRHEIVSGVTSSVAPELIGYRSTEHSNGTQSNSVVNYGSGNVSSWNDIHNTAEGGRLVFLIDSAGHPRYRRTTVRGLVSWTPHWTLCCVAANDQGGPTLSSEVANLEVQSNLSRAHLELCLKLNLALVVVITKYDLASKPGLRQTLARILSTVKEAGRKPVLLKPPSSTVSHDFYSLSAADEQEVRAAVSDPNVVPIVLASSVTGDGIGKLHALLRNLPIPSRAAESSSSSMDTLLHIDEVYTKPAVGAINPTSEPTMLLVASGLLRYGNLTIGDTLQLGPFVQSRSDTPPVDIHRARSYPSRLPFSLSPGTLPRRISGDFSALSIDAHARTEFIPVRVVSVRNLRLPLRRLRAGQAGTVGLELLTRDSDVINRVRKGMVLGRPAAEAEEGMISYGGLVARFGKDDYHIMQPGSLFNVYVASVRAAATIISVDAVEGDMSHEMVGTTGNGHAPVGMFGFEFDGSDHDEDISKRATRENMIDVAFQFVGCREWVERGAQVLVMPANGLEKSVGLDGFVGKVSETLD